MKHSAALPLLAVPVKLKFNSSWRRENTGNVRRRWFLRSIEFRSDKLGKSPLVIEIYWRRLVVAMSILSSAVYLLAATALFLWLERSPWNKVGWTDIALAPVRWEQFRESRGNSAIQMAIHQIEQRDYVEGFHGLRVGLQRAPSNVAGRVLLARLYTGFDPAQTISVLENGIATSANDLDYLRLLFSYYRNYQSVERALDQTAKLLAGEIGPVLTPEARQLIALARAGFLLDKGRAAEVLQLLPAPSARAATETEQHLVRLWVDALVRLGRISEATAEFANLRSEKADYDDFRVEAELAIAADDAMALEGALRRMRADKPTQPPPYLFTFQSWHRLKRLTLRDAAEQDYYRLFGGNDGAMQTLAAVSVNLSLPEVVQRAMLVAQRNRLNSFAFRVHLTEMALRRSDFDDAFRLVRDWESTVETLKPMQRFYPEFIRRLTRTTVAGGGDQLAGLISHISLMRGQATPGMLELAATVLESSNNRDAAQQALQSGLRLYPYSDNLQEISQRLTAHATSIAAATQATIDAEKAEKHRKLAASLPPTGQLAMSEIDNLLEQESLLGARELVATIRNVQPLWLPSFETELVWKELELAVLGRDAISSRTLVRTHLDRNRSDEDALRLVRIAERMLARNRETEARLLHDEVAAVRNSIAVAAALRGLNLSDDLSTHLGSADKTLATLDRLLGQGKSAEALRILEYVKSKSTSWWPSARDEFTVREVRIRLALDQRPLANTALKDLVIRSGVPRAAAFRLVRELITEGQSEFAIILAREVVRLLPGDPTAAKLLKEAEAPRLAETGN